MKYHTIKSDLWEDEKFQELTCSQKLLFIYLFANRRCPPSGIYKLSNQTICFELNVEITELKKDIKILCSAGMIAHDNSKNSFWIKGKIKHHKASFKDYMTVKSITNDLNSFVGATWHQSFFDRYPEFIDIGIELERMKKLRYGKDNA